MKPFVHHRPSDLGQASALARGGPSAFLAGGQTLIRDMKRGVRSHPVLVDIGRLLDRGIREREGVLVLGAGATHASVASSELVRARVPMLAAMAGHIADPQVRNRATLGGAFAANEPAGDYPAVALALGAVVQTTSRRIEAIDFFTGACRTALGEGEIVTSVGFPIPRTAGYAKILDPAARYPMVGACAVVGSSGDLRIAVTGASTEGAFRWREAESVPDDRSALTRVALPVTLRKDLFADASYREQLVRVLTRRALDAWMSGDGVTVYVHGAPFAGGLTYDDARMTS